MRLLISGRRPGPAALLAAAALRILALGLAGAFLSSTDARHHLVAPAFADGAYLLTDALAAPPTPSPSSQAADLPKVRQDP